MSCENLSKANFHSQLAPENCHGRNLETVDQEATAIRMGRKDEQREREKSLSNVGPLGMGGVSRDWEKEYKILERQEKRGHRGGMTMQAEDGLVNPPRGHSPETMRDTGTLAERLLVRDMHRK